MNIKQAKEQIKNAVIAYHTKDVYGRPTISAQRQRPIFLMGPPGIGKTAIVEQIAQEMGLPLVSYSMTHHTRQSALGLPFIYEKQFDGQSFRVSEYTMSEIIAAVYDKMEQTGLREGILFLDEINCVSETLAPSMLQFLQYKVFGQHKVPEGWIVVTAGNPPEYNQSVREFDIVTWDRLKRIDVEADFDTWRSWAVEQGIHPAVLSYLDIRKVDFYLVESTADGKSFVTPRGWVDLSDMLKLYAQLGIKADRYLIGQYLQNDKISSTFSHYYDLWTKYQSDYQIDSILAGKASREIRQRAKNGKFDERISLVGLLMDAVLNTIRPVMQEQSMLEEAVKALQEIRRAHTLKHTSMEKLLLDTAEDRQKKLQAAMAGGMISREQENTQRELIAFMKEASVVAADAQDAPLDAVKGMFDQSVKEQKKQAAQLGKQLEHMFAFAEDVFGEGQEMLIIVTEMTASAAASQYIAKYGCPGYFRNNKALLFYERQKQLIQEIDQLEAAEDQEAPSQTKDKKKMN
ncbi:MAG: MoxR family ATPase [Clostridiales bacterium]|nr:MoxR family ATPase [Clostridiales bacterium]